MNNQNFRNESEIKEFLSRKYGASHSSSSNGPKFRNNVQLYSDLCKCPEIIDLGLSSKDKFQYICKTIWKIYKIIFDVSISEKAKKLSKKRENLIKKKKEKLKEYGKISFQMKQMSLFNSNVSHDKNIDNLFFIKKGGRRVKKRENGITVASYTRSRNVAPNKEKFLSKKESEGNIVLLKHQKPTIKIRGLRKPKENSFLLKKRDGSSICNDEFTSDFPLKNIGLEPQRVGLYKVKGLKIAFDSKNNKEEVVNIINDSEYSDKYYIYDYGKGTNSILSNDGFMIPMNETNLIKFFEKEKKRGKLYINQCNFDPVNLFVVTSTDGIGYNDNGFLKFYERSNNPRFLKYQVSTPYTFFKIRGSKTFRKDSCILHCYQLRNLFLSELNNLSISYSDTSLSFDDGVMITSDFLNKLIWEGQYLTYDRNGMTSLRKDEFIWNPWLKHHLIYISKNITLFTKSIEKINYFINQNGILGKTKMKNLVLENLRKYGNSKAVPLMFTNREDINPLIKKENYLAGVLIFNSLASNLQKIKEIESCNFSFVIIDFKIKVFEDIPIGNPIKLDLAKFCMKKGKIIQCFSKIGNYNDYLKFPSSDNMDCFVSDCGKIIWDSVNNNNDSIELSIGCFYVYVQPQIEKEIDPSKCIIGLSNLHSCQDFFKNSVYLQHEEKERENIANDNYFESLDSFYDAKPNAKGFEYDNFFSEMNISEMSNGKNKVIVWLNQEIISLKKTGREINDKYVCCVYVDTYLAWNLLKTLSLKKYLSNYMKCARKFLGKRKIVCEGKSEGEILKRAFSFGKEFLSKLKIDKRDSMHGNKVYEVASNFGLFLNNKYHFVSSDENTTEGMHKMGDNLITTRDNHNNRGTFSNRYIYAYFEDVKPSKNYSHSTLLSDYKNIIRVCNCVIKEMVLFRYTILEFINVIDKLGYIMSDTRNKSLYILRNNNVRSFIRNDCQNLCCCGQEYTIDSSKLILLNQWNIDDIYPNRVFNNSVWPTLMEIFGARIKIKPQKKKKKKKRKKAETIISVESEETIETTINLFGEEEIIERNILSVDLSDDEEEIVTNTVEQIVIAPEIFSDESNEVPTRQRNEEEEGVDEYIKRYTVPEIENSTVNINDNNKNQKSIGVKRKRMRENIFNIKKGVDLDLYSVESLKEYLNKRNIKKDGKKLVLIDRIQRYFDDNLSSQELQSIGTTEHSKRAIELRDVDGYLKNGSAFFGLSDLFGNSGQISSRTRSSKRQKLSIDVMSSKIKKKKPDLSLNEITRQLQLRGYK